MNEGHDDSWWCMTRICNACMFVLKSVNAKPAIDREHRQHEWKMIAWCFDGIPGVSTTRKPCGVDNDVFNAWYGMIWQETLFDSASRIKTTQENH